MSDLCDTFANGRSGQKGHKGASGSCVLPESLAKAPSINISSFNQQSLMQIFYVSDKFPLIYQPGSRGILPQNAKCQKFILLDI